MPVSIEELRPYLRDFDFPGLFVEGLGWNHHTDPPFAVHDGAHDYTLTPVAEKANFVVWECGPGADGTIPDMPARRRIEAQAEKRAHEHLIVFTDAQRAAQVWQWVKREHGKAAYRNFQYRSGDNGTPLLQRLQGIAFALEEEGGLTIAGVASRVRQALDVEKVTKRFYERFSKELKEFGGFIEGITAQGDRDWYASLMLNRMMFVYFIQKQRFLDNDPGYLRNRLQRVQAQSGSGHFQQFYRIFLLRLFHEGLGQPEAQRVPDLAALLGRVPFLNGGLFDMHDLERGNPDIAIPDEAFERVFDFFDAYQWHLDERPRRNDNEINPDVLGYIFEKYVNQKQMGAYYTKEDITGYISRNTVIPFLFDAARKSAPIAFRPDGGVWRLLRDDPDRYIYPAVGHGITWNARDAQDLLRLGAPFELPAGITEGLDDVSKRGGWNAPAPDEYALPTETWREVVARRKRYTEVRAKLAAGEVTEINDLITLNLDIERFAQDVIDWSEGAELVRAFWHALTLVFVLDPTCGSGAFLFAALNVLEPLYTACLEGMRGFLDDLERSERPRNPNALRDFREVLDDAAKHPSERYFILKSIVLNNLYGVDIEQGAVEICKLRLFLKLVAQLETYDQIEPLPDIDFNVRAGNTLVGFTSLDAVRQAMTITPDGQYRAVDQEQLDTLARIEEEAGIASTAFTQFRWQQTLYGGEVTHEHKSDLRARLDSLNRELNGYLAAKYGVDPQDAAAYSEWLTSHKPFHWFAEFYGIMHNGGFDVVIGNPPWREYTAVKKDYQVQSYKTESCGNLYALCMERSIALASQGAWFSFIVQLPLLSSSRMESLRVLLVECSSDFYFIPFDDRPGKLFEGLQHCRSTIFVTRIQASGESSIRGAKYQRWSSVVREHLFYNIGFTSVTNIGKHGHVFPKLADELQSSVLGRLNGTTTHPLSVYLKNTPAKDFVFYQESMQYWAKATYGLPFYSKNGIKGAPPHGRYLHMSALSDARCIATVINSSLFYAYFISYSDCFHLNDALVSSFPLVESVTSDAELIKLSRKLMDELHEEATIKTIGTKVGDSITYEEFSAAKSKPIIDEIDRALAKHYEFTEEELDFIINYDIKYRMGREG